MTPLTPDRDVIERLQGVVRDLSKLVEHAQTLDDRMETYALAHEARTQVRDVIHTLGGDSFPDDVVKPGPPTVEYIASFKPSMIKGRYV